MTVIAAGPVSTLVVAFLSNWALSSTGSAAIGRSTIATATLGEMADQRSPHVSFDSRDWLNSALRATSAKSVAIRAARALRRNVQRPLICFCVRARVRAHARTRILRKCCSLWNTLACLYSPGKKNIMTAKTDCVRTSINYLTSSSLLSVDPIDIYYVYMALFMPKFYNIDVIKLTNHYSSKEWKDCDWPDLLHRCYNFGVNGCIQRIQQLSESLVIIACDWNKLLDPRWI